MKNRNKNNIIRRNTARILIPFIQLFGLYVIAHGEFGPGGGFQGGVIFAASIILYALVFGMEEGRKRMSQKTRDSLSSAGVLIYAGIGALSIAAGGAYLEYAALPLGSPKLASHLGIFGVEVGVGIAVAAVMATIFFEVVGQEND